MSIDAETYLGHQRERVSGSRSPEIWARIFAHSNRIPWERVRALVAFSKLSSQFAVPRLGELVDWWEAVEADPYQRLFALCESPIEELFLAHVIAACCDPCERPRAYTWDGDTVRIPPSAPDPDQALPISLTPQFAVDRYRVDLLLTAGDLLVACEMDGHEFHERTKEQAQRDKSRDRSIQALGYRVLRYTGSEIWANPKACAQEAVKQVRGG